MCLSKIGILQTVENYIVYECVIIISLDFYIPVIEFILLGLVCKI